MEAPNPALSAACIACTIGMFGSGISDVRRMLATQSVDNVQLLPFLTTHVNNVGWLSYGCMKGDTTLVVVNGIGAALQSFYIAVYWRYCSNRVSVLLRLLSLLSLLGAVILVLQLQEPGGRSRTERVGLVCCVCTVCMYGCPIADMGYGLLCCYGVAPHQLRAFRSRSVRCLSLPLSISTFMASGCWALYGVSTGDPFVTIPNVPGVLTSAGRLWLFWRYSERPQGALQT